MVVAPLEHRDPRSPPNPGNYVLEVEKVKGDTERRSPPAAPLTFLCSDNNITCSSSSNAASGPLVDHGQNITGDAAKSCGQIWTRPGSSATSQSASTTTIVAKPNNTVVDVAPPSGGLKRRRDSSVSSSSSSSDEETGVVASKYHRKRRFFSHREYKGRKGGSPPGLERRVRCRRRSGSCSSSPDTRQGSDYYFSSLIIEKLPYHILNQVAAQDVVREL